MSEQNKAYLIATTRKNSPLLTDSLRQIKGRLGNSRLNFPDSSSSGVFFEECTQFFFIKH